MLANTITLYYITKLLCLKQLAGWYSYRGPFWRLLCGIQLSNLLACLVKSLRVGFGRPSTSTSITKIPKAQWRPLYPFWKWSSDYVNQTPKAFPSSQFVSLSLHHLPYMPPTSHGHMQFCCLVWVGEGWLDSPFHEEHKHTCTQPHTSAGLRQLKFYYNKYCNVKTFICFWTKACNWRKSLGGRFIFIYPHL